MTGTGVLHLTKYHGAGNDFLVLLDPDGERPLSAAQVRALCDRHRGVGADGVLRATRGGEAMLTMELRNADGGAAEMSGNGIRCLVQAAVDAGWVDGGVVTVATASGVRCVEYRTCAEPGHGFAGVEMGRARLGAELAPDVAPGAQRVRLVDMGNPHVVVLGHPVDASVVSTVGARLEHTVEGGANVEFVWPGPADGELTLRVWERGVGETLACGTGTCAAAAAAHGWGVVGREVRVHNPGGTLEVSLRDGGVYLAGPTRRVAEISVDDAVLPELSVVAP